MKIVFIGAGNLATRLSLAMQRVGMQIGQVYSHTEASARQLATRLGCPWTNDLSALPGRWRPVCLFTEGGCLVRW